MERTFFCIGLILFAMAFLRLLIEFIINPLFAKCERETLEYKARALAFYLGLMIAFGFISFLPVDDMKICEIFLAISFVGFGWYLKQILCMYRKRD